jgi:hypothetical protein
MDKLQNIEDSLVEEDNRGVVHKSLHLSISESRRIEAEQLLTVLLEVDYYKFLEKARDKCGIEL